MEKFFLYLRFVFQKLYVVDNQHVHVPIMVTELCATLLRNRVDKLVQELFASGIKHFLFRRNPCDMVRNRVHKVGFAQARFPIYKKRVKGFPGVFGNRFCRSVNELAPCACDEGIKGKALIDRGILESIGGVFFDCSGKIFAAVYDQAEIVQAKIAFDDRLTELDGKLIHNGMRVRIGNGFQDDFSADDVHRFKIFNKMIVGNGRNEILHPFADLFPNIMKLRTFCHFIPRF